MPALFRQYSTAWRGKVGIVPLSRESFFLSRGDNLAVADQAGRRVVIEGREPENRCSHNRFAAPQNWR